MSNRIGPDPHIQQTPSSTPASAAGRTTGGPAVFEGESGAVALEKMEKFLDVGYADPSEAPTPDRMKEYVKIGEDVARQIFSDDAPTPDTETEFTRKEQLCGLMWYLMAVTSREGDPFERGMFRLTDQQADKVTDWLSSHPESYDRISSHYVALSNETGQKFGHKVGKHKGIDITFADRGLPQALHLPSGHRTVLFDTLKDGTAMVKIESHSYNEQAADVAKRMLSGKPLSTEELFNLASFVGKDTAGRYDAADGRKEFAREAKADPTLREHLRELVKEPKRHALEMVEKLFVKARVTQLSSRREDDGLKAWNKKLRSASRRLQLGKIPSRTSRLNATQMYRLLDTAGKTNAAAASMLKDFTAQFPGLKGDMEARAQGDNIPIRWGQEAMIQARPS